MRDLEDRVHEAFDAVTLPPNMKEATLAYIQNEEASHTHTIVQDTSQTSVQAGNSTVQDESNYTSAGTASTDDEANSFSLKPAKSPNSRRYNPLIFSRRVGFAVAACLLLCAIGFGGYNTYAEETAIVGVDLNPSLEMGINRFNRVVEVRSLNEDGQEVLNDISIQGLSYDEAIEKLAVNETFSSYIRDDSFIDITVVCEDSAQSSYLFAQSEKTIETLPCAGVCNHMSNEEHHEAQETGMGLGRYAAAQALMSLDPSLSLEDCSAMTMRQLRDRITELDPTNDYAHHGDSQGATMGDHKQQRGEGRAH